MRLVSISPILFTFAFATVSHAATGIFGSYIALSDNGAPLVWYEAVGTSLGGGAPDIENQMFGVYNIGDSLNIGGAEVLTFKNNSADPTGDDVLNASLWYAIVDPADPRPAATAFTQVPLGFTANASFNDAAGLNFTNPGDQKWSDIMGVNPDLLAGLGKGNYAVELFFSSDHNNGGTNFNNTASSGLQNFRFEFEIVPEPSRALLLLGGLVSLALQRRR